MTLIITTVEENVTTSLSKAEIKSLAEPLLKKRDLKGDWLLECRFVSKKAMKQINYESRKINQVTDVLSFPVRFATNIEDPDKIIPETGIQVLGSLVISPEVAHEEALRKNIAFKKELLCLISHGIRHLLGKDHDDEGNWNKRKN